VKRFLSLEVFSLTLATIHCAGNSASVQAVNVTALWTGTTRVTPPCTSSSGRCNAVNNITLYFKQQGGRIKGKYTCAYGNLNCRNGDADNTGKIVSGRISGSEVRLSVVVPANLSSCYYNGRLASPSTIHGTYFCYQGGDLAKEGMWDVKHASAQ